MGTLHEMYIYLISSQILLKMRNVSDKVCRENWNTLYVQNIINKNHAVNEIMRKNMAEPDRPQIWEYNMACALCMLDN